jgi:hypothetical protein
MLTARPPKPSCVSGWFRNMFFVMLCKCNIQTVLLKVGIWIPETCGDIYGNKSQLLHQVGNSCHNKYSLNV